MRTYLAALAGKEKVSRLNEVPLLTLPVRALVQLSPSLPVSISKVEVRALPLWNAICTPVTVSVSVRQNWIHCPSPLADQRVFRSPSSTLAGTLPSSAL